jgi:predicted  nucleic acid-binding Zn-ribbon protein
VASEADSWSLGELTRERDRLESEVDEMERRKQAGDVELERAKAAAAKAVPHNSMMAEFEKLSVDVERANQCKVDAENQAVELEKALGEATAQARQEENRLAEAEKELRTALALNR